MSGTTAPAPVATLTLTALQTFMLRLINESRAAAGTGLRPLVLDAELIVAAQGHAQYMVDADVFSHIGQGGSSPAQRGTAAGYNWTRFGENVAMIAGTGATLNERVVRQMHTNLAQNFGTPTAAELADGTGIAEPAPAPDPTPVPAAPAPTPEPVPTAPPAPAPVPSVQMARVTVTAGDVVQHLDLTLGGAAPVVTVVPRGS